MNRIAISVLDRDTQGRRVAVFEIRQDADYAVRRGGDVVCQLEQAIRSG